MKGRLALIMAAAVLAIGLLVSLAVPNAIGAAPSPVGAEVFEALDCNSPTITTITPLWDATSPGESSAEAALTAALSREGIRASDGRLLPDVADQARFEFEVGGHTKALLTVYQPPAGGWTIDSVIVCAELVAEAS